MIRLGTRAARWVVAAAVLGSGSVFLESTVVSVALPSMGRDLGLDVRGLQWIVNGYMLSLSALLLLGGAFGDARGQKRVFEWGLLGFAAGSVLCALAPSFPMLVAARILQGAAGALLVPTSLAFLDTSFVEEDRSAAIGAWSAWSAVSTAAGPLLGGALVDAASWRWVFAAAVPLPLAAWAISRFRVAEEEPPEPSPVDVAGGVLATGSLGALVWALVEGPERGLDALVVAAGLLGLGLGALFLRLEARRTSPLLPLGLFRDPQFAGANGTTLLIYAALGALFFFLMIQLQSVMGYGALVAGAALLPINLLMLLLSPRAGRWAARSGARVPITVSALVAAAGLALFARLDADSAYLTDVLPAVVVFGLGLSLLVAPLTAAALSVAGEGRTGVASAVNNAAARLAGLLATALVPLLAGVGGLDDYTGAAFTAGFRRAMWISAGLCVAGGAVAWSTVRAAPGVPDSPHPSPTQGCARREVGV